MKLTIVMAGLLLANVARVDAQLPGVDLSLYPRVGSYRPAGALAEQSGSEARLQPGRAVGLSAELQLPLLPLHLRGNVDYVLNTNGEVNEQVYNSDNSILILSADLVYRLLPSIVPVQPYLLAGAGVKKYDFDNSFATALFSFPDRNDFTVHLGAGLGFKLGPIGVLGEVGDYVSRFETQETGDRKLQNDLFAMVGVRVSLF
jgi:hypothetical protein